MQGYVTFCNSTGDRVEVLLNAARLAPHVSILLQSRPKKLEVELGDISKELMTTLAEFLYYLHNTSSNQG